MIRLSILYIVILGLLLAGFADITPGQYIACGAGALILTFLAESVYSELYDRDHNARSRYHTDEDKPDTRFLG